MSNVIPFVGQLDGSRVYRLGVIGTDTGTADPSSGVYQGRIMTERVSPMGEGGLALFRRAIIRVLKSGVFTATFKVYIDDVQTQIFDATSDQSVLIPQVVVVTSTASALKEEIITIDLSQQGTYFQLECTVDSDDLSGVFLIESITAEMYPIRETISRGGES